MLTENDIAKIVVDICFKIHYKYGPGLFEFVYEEIFCYEWKKMNIAFIRQQGIPLVHEEIKPDIGFSADVIIDNNKVVVEIKSIELLSPVHYKQVQTYLKLTEIKLGLLVNLNVNLIKEGIHRIVNIINFASLHLGVFACKEKLLANILSNFLGFESPNAACGNNPL